MARRRPGQSDANYWFHIKGFFIGEALALAVCAVAAAVVQFVLG